MARVSAGLSLTQVGRAVGLSQSQVGRIERARHPSVSVMQLARIASVVGLDLSVRAYPNGSPLRDAAHLALIMRFRARLAPTLSLRTEVPLPIAGDLRAWDMVIRGAGEPIGVEAETRLVDMQALERRVRLKMRDGGIHRVVILASASRGNRIAIRAADLEVSAFLPIRGRVALAALTNGTDPGGSALILI
jgi:transcriptional regulator with XRE-family HTH domain